MSDLAEAYERDLDWLAKNFGQFSEDEGDAFAEKVALFCHEGKAETTARYMAMVLIRDKRNGRHK